MKKQYLIQHNTIIYGPTVMSESELETFLDGLGEHATIVSEADVIIDATTKLISDMTFGNLLIQEFLLDNRNDPNVKSSDSLVLLQKFQAVKELLSLGDIKKCVPLINYMTVDSIFTQERKTKYIDMINAYLSN